MVNRPHSQACLVQVLCDLSITDCDTCPGCKKRKLYQPQPPSRNKRKAAVSSEFANCQALGPKGLYNMGQTCFMSAVLQSLLHNPVLRNWFLANGHNSGECAWQQCLSCALYEMFVEFYAVGNVGAYGAVTMLLRSWTQEQVWFLY